MLNREIKVGIVKKLPSEDESYISLEERANIVTAVVDHTAKKIIGGIAVYIVLDTVRKLLLNSQK